MIEIPFSWRPRLRTVLIAVVVLVLTLPVVGILAIRQYENELVRATEELLLAQGALVRELFLAAYGQGVTSQPEVLEPILDLGRDAVLPRPPDASAPTTVADPAALEAGRIIEPRIRSATSQTLTGIRVVDGHGIVVATSRAEAGLSLAERHEVREALAGRRASVLRERVSDDPSPPLVSSSRGQRYRVFVALPIHAGEDVVGAVVLSRTPLDLMKALWLRRKPVLLASGATVFVALLVAAVTALFVGRPVSLLIDQARRAARGERGAVREIRGAGTREMRELSVVLAELARTVENREEYIRTFAAHVSHEFKTPLTTIRGALELLGEHRDGGDPAEREALLRSALAASTRLQRLVERLLDLARAEAASRSRESADVVCQVATVAARFRDDRLIVTTSSEAGHIAEAAIAADALDAALSQLLENARSHGASRVHVAIRPESSPLPAVVVDVSDDGPGISEANVDRVFAPFFTTARDRGGTGLGLSIARALVEGHGGTVELKKRQAQTTFRIRLPRSQPR